MSARKHIDALHRNVGTLLLHEGREQPIAAAYVQYAHICRKQFHEPVGERLDSAVGNQFAMKDSDGV
jgi:hypothetical protein